LKHRDCFISEQLAGCISNCRTVRLGAKARDVIKMIENDGLYQVGQRA